MTLETLEKNWQSYFLINYLDGTRKALAEMFTFCIGQFMGGLEFIACGIENPVSDFMIIKVDENDFCYFKLNPFSPNDNQWQLLGHLFIQNTTA